MNRRRPVPSIIAAVVISGITAFLLFRLSHRQSTPIIPGAKAPVAVSFPPVLPIVTEASAPPMTVSGTVPSPDWKIAFECYESEAKRTDVWVANGDGSNPHCVLKDAEFPCWSPQRRLLAFARGGNVWVANADGTRPRQLTFWPTTSGDDRIEIHGIAWNAHDNVLSFSRGETYQLTRERGSESETVEGNTIYHLALRPAAEAHATLALPFAPVAYETPTSGRNTGDKSIWRRIPPRFDLTEHHGRFNFAENEYPAWSPSGTKMAFVREGDVWLAEGEEESGLDQGYAQDWSVSRIAASAQYDGHTVGSSHWIIATTGISWAPNESWLVYGAERVSGSGQNDLHLLRRSEEKWLDTPLKYSGDSPCVSPDGRWILYTYRGALYAITPDQKKQIVLIQRTENLWCDRAIW